METSKPTHEEIRDAAYALLKARGVNPIECDQSEWAMACAEARTAIESDGQ